MLLSTDRLIALFHALRYDVLVTKRKAIIAIGTVWSISFILTSIELASYHVTDKVLFNKVYVCTSVIIFLLIPSGVLIVQYTSMILLVNKILKNCPVKYLKKKMETKLADKVSAGHFKSKEKDKKVYMQLTKLHNNNTTDDLLRMINHGYDTQGIEAMNKSCSAFATKGETFSKTGHETKV